MTTKSCFKCGQVKPFTGFYRHAGMADGHLGKCKECTKSDVGKHRELNLGRVRAYDRSRGSLPHRVAARAAYAATPAYAASHATATAKYDAEHPDRAKARNAVNNAIRDGRLVPWPVCAVPECCDKPHGHHPDYERPLDVVWLCPAHHKQAHAIAEAEKFLPA